MHTHTEASNTMLRKRERRRKDSLAGDESILSFWQDDVDSTMMFESLVLSSIDEYDDYDDDDNYENLSRDEHFLTGNSGSNVLSSTSKENYLWVHSREEEGGNDNYGSSEQDNEDNDDDEEYEIDDDMANYNPKRYCLGLVEGNGEILVSFFGDYEFAIQEYEFFLRLEYDCILRYYDKNMKLNIKKSGDFDQYEILENRCDTTAT